MTNCSHPMTPVQLPEVPAPSAWAMTDYQPEANTQFTMRVDAAEHYASVGLQVEPLYTADQLRAYATEAVMAERARLRTAVADYMHSEGCSCCRGNDHDEHKAVIAGLLGVAPYSDNSGFDFAPYRTGATQPEQNSGR